MKITKRLTTAFATAALFSGVALAGGSKECLVINDKAPIENCKEDPCICEIFDYGTLYKDSDNTLIQKVQFVGRYHGQYYDTSIDTVGGTAEAQYWEHRRFRLGVKVQFLNDFTFFNNWNIADNEALTRGDFFDSPDEMYIKWKPSGASNGFFVTVGKVKQKITREFSTSSKKILTLERSHIVNEVADKKPWGIITGFEAMGAKHTFAGYLNGLSDDDRWPDFDTRGAFQYSMEYGLTDATDLHFDYLYTNNSNGTVKAEGNSPEDQHSEYNHVLALGTESAWDIGPCDRQFGLVTDIIYASDREAQGTMPAGEDTFGFVFMPSVDLTQNLQFVAKYAYADSARLQRPFRRGTGIRPNLEEIHTFYAGLNYYICDQNLKLMAGYEFINAKEFGTTDEVEGGTFSLGVRTYW